MVAMIKKFLIFLMCFYVGAAADGEISETASFGVEVEAALVGGLRHYVYRSHKT